MKKQILILLLLVLILNSCQKNVSDRVAGSQIDVYVAGSEYNGSVYVAKYWKNGQAIALTDGTKDADATSLFVSGNDVYVCGSIVGEGAVYWKNGSLVILGGSYASGIAVSGNDVYITGSMQRDPNDSYHAVIWKNGLPFYLPENTRSGDWADIYPISSKTSVAYSIFISGPDVYVAGEEEISRTTSPYPDLGTAFATSAVYWKNGNEIYLIKGPYADSYADETRSIFIFNGDVYACGALEGKYWKNGNPVELGGTANSIFVSNGDVYVGGTQTDGQPYQTYNGERYRVVAKYWKNGNPISLTDGSKNAYATSIAVSGNDVYVAGYEENTPGAGDNVAKYWKNGSPIVLGNASKESGAQSIFLVKK